MATFVAFLRGMNLGRRRVKNDELIDCFEGMGFAEVSAFLASGNVIFSTRRKAGAKLEGDIAKGLEAYFDYAVDTFVRSAAEVAQLGAASPFSAAQSKGKAGKVQVALLSKAPSAAVGKKVLAFAGGDDALVLEGRELFWLPKAGLSDSELDLRGIEKLVGSMTIRTQRTYARLAAKLER